MRRRELDSVAFPSGEHLREPIVERYVSGREIAAHTFQPDCATCTHSGSVQVTPRSLTFCDSSLKLLTRRRWMQARRDWAAAHGLSDTEQVRHWPHGRPRWAQDPTGRV